MINVAIIGTGNISGAHLEAYQRFPDRCRVVAMCDVVPRKAEARKQAFDLPEDVAVVASHEELLDRTDVDLVDVCTPPSSHAPIAVDFLDAGKHVVVEKPMAPSLAQCDQILAAQRRSGAMLSVIAQNRFRDDMVTVKTVLDSGLLGPVAHLRVDSAWWRGVPYYDLSWRGTWESEGGGPTLNHAIHHVDLMLWMLGMPESVAAMMTNAWHDNAEVEDLSVALLQYERALAQLTSSVVHHGEEQQIVVQGRDASVAQPWSVRAEVTQPNGFPAAGGNPTLVAQLEAVAAAHEPLPHVGHAGQLQDVLGAVEHGRTPLITGQDGRRTVEVVTAIYRAAIERRTVDLPIEPTSGYYDGTGLLAHAPRYFTKTRSADELDGSIRVSGSAAASS